MRAVINGGSMRQKNIVRSVALQKSRRMVEVVMRSSVGYVLYVVEPMDGRIQRSNMSDKRFGLSDGLPRDIPYGNYLSRVVIVGIK